MGLCFTCFTDTYNWHLGPELWHLGLCFTVSSTTSPGNVWIRSYSGYTDGAALDSPFIGEEGADIEAPENWSIPGKMVGRQS